MTLPTGPITIDTNIVIYALGDEGRKTELAEDAVGRAAFVSVQLLNELANVLSRKHGRAWPAVEEKIADVKLTIGNVLPLDSQATDEALRIAARYRLSFYDSLMIAVALAGGAGTLYSEDMQHGLIIDGRLTITNPFREAA